MRMRCDVCGRESKHADFEIAQSDRIRAIPKPQSFESWMALAFKCGALFQKDGTGTIWSTCCRSHDVTLLTS